jgi:hypothetical protein
MWVHEHWPSPFLFSFTWGGGGGGFQDIPTLKLEAYQNHDPLLHYLFDMMWH